MLTFDTLRVKNASYGGDAASLEWALTAHSHLASQGIKNSLAQSWTLDALQEKIAGVLPADLTSQSWARQKLRDAKPRAYEASRSPWQGYLLTFLFMLTLSFLTFGVLGALSESRELSAGWLLALPLLSLLTTLLYRLFCYLLGLKNLLLVGGLVFLLVLGLVFLLAYFLDGGILADSRSPLAVWIFLALGSLSGVLTALVLKADEAGRLPFFHSETQDAAWIRQARSYSRRTLLHNERYLESHLAAAIQAGAQENRPLVQMCGNPASYMKTAPADPGYKHWVQMIGFCATSLLVLVLVLISQFLGEAKIWFYLILLFNIYGIFEACRSYLKAKK